MSPPLRLAIAVAAFAFPITALADLSGNVVLQTNTALNLDTGTTAASGGDILWTGSGIAPQGSAKAYSTGDPGLFTCTGLAQSYYQTFASSASSAAIPNSKLTAGSGFIVVTAGGHLARVCVADNSSGSTTLFYKTFGVSGATGVPVVSQILNNSSLIPFGQTNYGIPPSSIFVVTGSNLADPGSPALQSSAPPGIPQTLNGASITVVVNGVTTHPALYYTSPAQLAAVMPAATPVGSGTLTVTYNGNTSAPALIQVVPSALGINFYNTNTSVATDASSGDLITYNNSASPGQTITLWTTGLGADPNDSDTTYSQSPHAVSTPLQVYIGGMPANILYQGSAGFPGVNQINVTIPKTVPPGCWVSLVAVTGSVISNAVTLPVMSGGGACNDVVTGVNANQISGSPTQTLRTGFVTLIQAHNLGIAGTTNSTTAAFEKDTGLYSPSQALSPGGCIMVSPSTPAVIQTPVALDAGTVTLTGPNALSVTLAPTPGLNYAFYAILSAGAIPSTGGAFTFKGSGGADVGPFTSTLTLANPLLTLTSQPGAITDRTQSLPVTWTGGNPGSYVYVSGTSTSASPGVTAGFSCLVSADLKQFTVPSYILLGLPAGNGAMSLQNVFYAPLPASGLDVAFAEASVGYYGVLTTFK